MRPFTRARARAKARAAELISRFDLEHAASRPTVKYSGMRRRLDLAASIVRRPRGAVPRVDLIGPLRVLDGAGAEITVPRADSPARSRFAAEETHSCRGSDNP